MPIHIGSVQQQKKPLTRIGLAIFFAFFFLMGTMFLVFMSRQAWRSVDERRWIPTPCAILSSEVVENSAKEKPFEFRVRYGYERQGRKFTSDVYKKNYVGSKDYSEAVMLRQRYAVNLAAQAFVNPQKPSEAILQPQELWAWAFVFIPVVFMIVGAGGVYFVLTDKSDVILSSKKPPLTQAKCGPYIAILVFLLFAVGGSIFVLTWSLPKLHEAFDSQSWTPTSCKIISSRLESHYDSQDNTTTYSIEILYRYMIKGVEFKSNRYDLIGGSSSGKASKKKILQKYPEGSKAVCLVNPKNPFEAVLVSGLTGMHFILLMPVIFALVGIGGLVIFVSKQFLGEGKAENFSTLSNQVLSASGQVSTASGRVVLKQKFSPLTRFLGFFIGAAIEVTITAFMIRYAMQEKEWMLIIFGVIFGLIGIALICATFWYFLALFNPRLEVVANSQRVPLGGIFEVNWKFLGDVQRMDRLQIHLKGREEATYSQGTRTCTDKNIFAQIMLLDTTVKWDIATGQCSVEIPSDTMHSFNAKNNKIVWVLIFEAEISFWPDVKEEYPIEILPKQV